MVLTAWIQGHKTNINSYELIKEIKKKRNPKAAFLVHEQFELSKERKFACMLISLNLECQTVFKSAFGDKVCLLEIQFP